MHHKFTTNWELSVKNTTVFSSKEKIRILNKDSISTSVLEKKNTDSFFPTKKINVHEIIILKERKQKMIIMGNLIVPQEVIKVRNTSLNDCTSL